MQDVPSRFEDMLKVTGNDRTSAALLVLAEVLSGDFKVWLAPDPNARSIYVSLEGEVDSKVTLNGHANPTPKVAQPAKPTAKAPAQPVVAHLVRRGSKRGGGR